MDQQLDTFLAYFQEYTEVKWILIGALLLVLEIFTGTMWMFFAGLAALTLGGLLSFKIVNLNDFLMETGWFFALTAAYAVILWKPLKKGLRKKGAYDTLIGSPAVVVKKLKKGKMGIVKWSGTNMNARLLAELSISEIGEGEEVWVHKVEGNTLIVSPFSPGVKLD